MKDHSRKDFLTQAGLLALSVPALAGCGKGRDAAAPSTPPSQQPVSACGHSPQPSRAVRNFSASSAFGALKTRVDPSSGEIIASTDRSQQLLHATRKLCQGAMPTQSDFVRWQLAQPREFGEILEVLRRDYPAERKYVEQRIPGITLEDTPKKAARILAMRTDAIRNVDPYTSVRKGAQRAIVYAYTLSPEQYQRYADASAEMFGGEVRWMGPEQRRAVSEIIARVQASPSAHTAIAAYGDVLPAGMAPDSKILQAADPQAEAWARAKYAL